MNTEIERKFLPKELPDLSGLKKSVLERHFLFNQNGIELRIQTNGEWYKLLRKTSVSPTERNVEEISLSKAEFDVLKTYSISSISRESYHLADSPKTDIRLYGGAFEGLVRVEFEFPSQEESHMFRIPDWVGAEITGSPLARDSQLLELTPEEFKTELGRYR